MTNRASKPAVKQLEEENLKLQKVVHRLKQLTYQYRSAEVIQNALFRISELAAQAQQMDNFYQSVHEIIGELMFAKNFYICLYDDQKALVNFVYFVDQVDKDILFEQLPIKTLANGLTGYVLRTGDALLCPPTTYQQLIRDGEVQELGAAHNDWLGVPLKSQDKTIGVMVVQSYDDEHNYTEKDKDLLVFVSQHVVTALERLQQRDLMQREIAHQTAELRHVNDSLVKEISVREKAEQQTAVLFAISELTNTSDNMTVFYKSLHQQIANLLQAENFYVALLSSDKKHLYFPYYQDETGQKGERRRLGRGLTEYVIRNQQPAFINLTRRQQLIESGEIRPAPGQEKIEKQWLGSPLILKGEVLGVIAVQSYGSDFLYQADDLELLNFVSQHVAVAIDRKRSAEEIRRVNQFLEKKVTERTEELVSEIERRKKIEAQLFHDAHHDNLTGLPNRALFTERLHQAVAHKRRHPEHHFAVLFLDLDRFKNINDTLGHSVGDQFLLEVSKRLNECIRDNDMVARLGGDEFVVLLDTMSSAEDAKDVAKRMISCLAEPFHLNGQDHFSGASVGIVLCRDAEESVERLLRDADAAMYQAKVQGRGRYIVFDQQMHQDLVKSVRLEKALRQADIETDFQLSSENIIDFASDQRIGCEARLQWHDGQRQLMADEFMPVAEKIGRVIALDQFLLRGCCQQIKQTSGNQAVTMHLKISARHLTKNSYVNALIEEVEAQQVSPGSLALEFTETSLSLNELRCLASLRRLAEVGFMLVISEFGAGIGPLQFLHSYPFDIVKLDHDFVAALAHDKRARTLLKHIAHLCAELNIELYATGIDSEIIFAQVRNLGVHVGQGRFVTDHQQHLISSVHF
ncbi:diguanylate cyclase [Idiomarina seosinensis]|uniref:sensor domain-containing phosphodiesterase n=1 Tax=Idiomarina seosinensis TaxID=281739 RepID=UPI00384BDF52